MNTLRRYRDIPGYAAVLVAGAFSLCAAGALGVGAGLVADFLIGKSIGFGPFGTGGMLVILVMLNVAVPVFIVAFTYLMSWHHPTSPLAPTLAFGFCVASIRLLGPFSIRFAPFVLGTGSMAWLICCLLLRKKERNKGWAGIPEERPQPTS